MAYRFRSELWMHNGSGPWHFVTLPIKKPVRVAERLQGGEMVEVELELVDAERP